MWKNFFSICFFDTNVSGYHCFFFKLKSYKGPYDVDCPENFASALKVRKVSGHNTH